MMPIYTVRWAPMGPEISVSCPTLEEALALADELVAIGKIGNIQILKDDQILNPNASTENQAMH